MCDSLSAALTRLSARPFKGLFYHSKLLYTSIHNLINTYGQRQQLPAAREEEAEGRKEEIGVEGALNGAFFISATLEEESRLDKTAV